MQWGAVVGLFLHSSIITWNGEEMAVVSHLFLFYRKISGAGATHNESHLPLFATIYFPTPPLFKRWSFYKFPRIRYVLWLCIIWCSLFFSLRISCVSWCRMIQFWSSVLFSDFSTSCEYSLASSTAIQKRILCGANPYPISFLFIGKSSCLKETDAP